MSSQLFPVLNPIDESFIRFKLRSLVHVEGDWHKGIQAHVIRANSKGTFDILAQQRSAKVDIATHKFDQSVATQMIKEDNLSEEAALKRGLAEELGITRYTHIKVSPPIRIVKTYHEHPTALNKELISLYLVTTADNLSTEGQERIDRAFWMEWSDYLAFFTQHAREFTKTAQLYLSCRELRQHIEHCSYVTLGIPLPEERPKHAFKTPIVHVNRSGAMPVTYFGNIEENLRKLGEL